MRRLEIVIPNREGVSLVEVMIALVVMLLVFFALMQTALVGIDANTQNSLRNEAVKVAEIRMNEVRNSAFESIVSDSGSPASTYNHDICLSGCTDCPSGFSTGVCICRDVKSISSFHFCTNVTSSDIGGAGSDNKQVTVKVGWKWKGKDYQNSITTVRNR